ncbi:MAG: acyltransferase [Pleurocapsa sp. MO_192.B19]|nr:acyltransferase [Pleurocapsa sp. MO_192.B19]
MMIARFFPDWSQAKIQLITRLLGWIPSLPGWGIRYVIYPNIFKKMGRSVKIHSGVELENTELTEIGNGVVFKPGVNLKLAQPTNVKIGSQVLLERDVRISCQGKESRLKLDTLVSLDRGVDLKVHQQGQMKIGKNTYIGPYTCISSHGKLTIGRDCLIASHSSIYAHNHLFRDSTQKIKDQGIASKGIVIEDDCWLGSGVRIVDGVTIGRGSVIGAGAVVAKDIPPYSVAVGVPAKVISQRTHK